ncbi:sigma-70 family RNA polymerase sigma factor [Lysinibacillus sp. NPDC047702]|uniref:sigma-70 family RNA polymerase sigma factor n=1 Tax=unclassified Lysinibacillus TaxID=2636778 RepID=UPI003CFF8203
MQDTLVQRAKKGDAEAFAQLFSQFEIDLYKMAYVYVGNEVDALDVVQEVAYRSFKYIHSLQSSIHIKTWLIRITINCATDLLKKRGQFLPYEMDELEKGEEPHEKLPQKWVMEDIITRLSKEEKDVILLRFYNDYTLSQVSQTLQLKLGTTKTILYRALKKLKQALEQEEEE